MPPETQNNDEFKKLVVENHRLLVENNQILRKMRRNNTFSAIFKIIWLVIFFALPLYFYYTYLQPNISQLQIQLNSLQEMRSEASGLMDWYQSAKQ